MNYGPVIQRNHHTLLCQNITEILQVCINLSLGKKLYMLPVHSSIRRISCCEYGGNFVARLIYIMPFENAYTWPNGKLLIA